MKVSQDKAIETLHNHIRKHYSLWTIYSRWYCGITGNIDDNINRHNQKIKRYKNGSLMYYYVECNSVNISRQVEKFFLDKGCQGDTGGGNEASVYVYVYRIDD